MSAKYAHADCIDHLKHRATRAPKGLCILPSTDRAALATFADELSALRDAAHAREIMRRKVPNDPRSMDARLVLRPVKDRKGQYWPTHLDWIGPRGPFEYISGPAEGAPVVEPAPVVRPVRARRATVRPASAPRPVVVPPARPARDDRPTCERCGRSFRKSGVGYAWHRMNRPDCAGLQAVPA